MLNAEPTTGDSPRKFSPVDRGRYKAIGLITLAKALRSLTNDEQWARFIAAVPEETRGILENPPPASQWIALRHASNAINTACEVIFNGEASRMFEVGRRSFSQSLKLVYKVFIRFMHPEHTIARAAQMWDTYYQGNGSVTCEQLTPNRVQTHMQGVVIPSPAFWEVLRGANLALVEATGLANPSVKVVEGGGESSSAVFELSWG